MLSTTSPATPEAATEPANPAPAAPVPRRRFPLKPVAIGLVVLGGGWWLLHHERASGSLDATHGTQLPIVAVTKVTREDLLQTMTMSAEFRPYQQVSLHAKIAGYLQSITVDVGDQVKEGQTIAQLDVPELKNELERASAAVRVNEEEVTRAEAIYTDAHLAFQRLDEVSKQHPKLVAQQDIDSAKAKDATAASGIAAAKQRVEESQAEEGKVRSMIAYTSITVPFDGVITRRYVDLGALVQAGTASGSQTIPVVDIAENKRLRLAFPVPESAVSRVKVGADVEFTVPALDETFQGKVSRYADKVDRATRTMLTEVDVENKDQRLKPGMIAEAKLVIRESKNTVAVPVQALTVGDQPSVMVIAANGTAETRPVKLGLQTPEKTEVLDGLAPGDEVVVGSRSGIQSGQHVTPKLIDAPVKVAAAN